ncbi:MAG: hypothetical protein ACK5TN_20305 [Acidobacteriota bacterium]
MQRFAFFLPILFLFPLSLASQSLRVPPESLGERLLAIVPMIGSGTSEDPFRPKYTKALPNPHRSRDLPGKIRSAEPTPEEIEADLREQKNTIIGFTASICPDGKRAIVEFVAYHRDAFSPLLKDVNVEVLDRKKLKDPVELSRVRKIHPGFDPSFFRTPVH